MLSKLENRDIHQTVPDHRVKLTQDGWNQVLSSSHATCLAISQGLLTNEILPKAAQAGAKLRSLLRPDDTLHFFTSPYRRTRETTEGILNALTTNIPTPSPFPRNTIKVYEEPRLREQDFGNFQPGSTEMSRMWQERANYGHFFYRIPNGESAADAYDRISGFNESLWRSFGEADFASVCVLVTHGLMTRVFLMKWYHFSVEYFEDLRNVDHCEFVVMKLNPDNEKFILQNQLRTWSQLKKEQEEAIKDPESPIPVRKRWGDSQDSCDAGGFERRQLARRQNTADLFMDEVPIDSAKRRRFTKATEPDQKPDQQRTNTNPSTPSQPTYPPPISNGTNHPSKTPHSILPPSTTTILTTAGRDGGGSQSGAASRSTSASAFASDEDADESDLFRQSLRALPVRGSSMAMALHGELHGGGGGGGERVRADALGDQSDLEEEEEEGRGG